jgi:hypothetical protein
VAFKPQKSAKLKIIPYFSLGIIHHLIHDHLIHFAAARHDEHAREDQVDQVVQAALFGPHQEEDRAEDGHTAFGNQLGRRIRETAPARGGRASVHVVRPLTIITQPVRLVEERQPQAKKCKQRRRQRRRGGRWQGEGRRRGAVQVQDPFVPRHPDRGREAAARGCANEDRIEGLWSVV